jgi:hypothetical protein
MAGQTDPPLYAEDLVYASYYDRLLIKALGVQAGVVEAEDYKVSAGSGLQVNVKKGKAFVEETKAIEESENSFYNGMYLVPNPTETNPYNSVEVSAANPQIAQIILRVYDIGELKTSGSSYGRIEWLNGTPTASATEAKMKEGVYEGIAELPRSSFRIARVLVPKNATKATEFYIEDSRNWIEITSLNSNVAAGSPVYVRQEGFSVRIYGGVQVKSGHTLTAGEVLFTLPTTAFYPNKQSVLSITREKSLASTTAILVVHTGGEAKIETTCSELESINLGQTYPRT